MVYSREQLEFSLTAHGDTLYRFALLLMGDDDRAAGLLRDLAAALGARLAASEVEPPPLDEPALLARLVVAARAVEERAKGRVARRPDNEASAQRLRRPRVNPFAPFAIHHLTLDQRAAIGLHLLLGYDGPRLAHVLGGDTISARAVLVGAARALGPAAGAALTDRVSGEQCEGVRAVLADPSAGSRHGAAVRGHLAGCALCRSFDHAWGVILAAVEEALRAALRPRSLPAALRARMLALASPRGARRLPSWRSIRVALAPLGVLALIAALALPGFMRQPVRLVDQQPGPPVDAQTLIARALERHAKPPDRGGVWHGRYETAWYFSDEVYAPLRADIWLDPRNPARHRLQLTHRDGGAPYELQIGDGVARLAYALDAAYAPALYGGLSSPARVEEPALTNMSLDTVAQVRARDERLRAGPWSLPPAYLRQAQSAGDLRLLGRQLDEGRLVQILTFSGVSPLGLPPDAPGATAERVTVLLALDSEDGLLRSATELSGPPGGAQVGRVTWRLVTEEWLSSVDQIDDAFAIQRAWTGIGSFGDAGRATSVDVAMPLLEARSVGDPAALLAMRRLPFWMPARAPAGVDRALLLWDPRSRQTGDSPYGLIYLGPGRRLVLAFNRAQVVAGEELSIGPWRVALRPGRGQRYTASAVRPQTAPALGGLGLFDPSATVLLDASGFTRAELEAVVASMAPFDLASLFGQDGLFVKQDAGDPAARVALLEAIADQARPPADGVWSITGRAYSRQDPGATDGRRDPYHLPLFEGRPQVTSVEEWQVGSGSGLGIYAETRNPADGVTLVSRYADGQRAWRHLPAAESLSELPPALVPESMRLPMAGALAVELLGQPGELTLERRPGGALLRHREQAIYSRRYSTSIVDPSSLLEPYLFDLRPITMTTELELGPAGEALATRVYAESLDGLRVIRTLVQSYELVSREAVPLAEAPAPLRDGTPPDALFTQPFSPWLRTSARILRRDTLEQAAGGPDLLIYAPAAAAATLLTVEEGDVAQSGERVDYGLAGGALREAVARRLAVRLAYRAPAGEVSPASFDINIVQGPALPLRAFLRGSPMVPWSTSEPIRLVVAGREVEGWYGVGDRTYLIVELDETLLVIDTSRPPDDPELRAVLAGLAPA